MDPTWFTTPRILRRGRMSPHPPARGGVLPPAPREREGWAARTPRGAARGVGNAERLKARAAPDEKRIRVPVIAAVQLHDRVPLGRGARDPDGRHGRLGARGYEAEPLGGGIESAHTLSQLDLERV